VTAWSAPARAPPRRRDVQHDHAGSHPLLPGVAQQRTVPGLQRQRPGQRQPRGVRAERAEPDRYAGRAHVQHQLLGQVGRVGSRQPNVDLARHRPGSRTHQRVAAAYHAQVDATQVDRDPRHRRHDLDPLLEALQPAHPDPLAARRQSQLVAEAERACAERPGHDGPTAAYGEAAVDPQAQPGIVGRWRQGADQPVEGSPQPGQTGAGAAGHRHRLDHPQRGGGEVTERLRDGGRRVGQVGPGHGEQPVPNAQRVDGGQVFGGLASPSLVRGHHDEHRRHRPDAGQHVGDEALVPRYVDEGHLLPGRQRGPGVAQVDGHPAPALLGPAVGLHARQRADQRRLAVVDVAGGGQHLH